jgi:hypothetical protein
VQQVFFKRALMGAQTVSVVNGEMADSDDEVEPKDIFE